MADYPRLSDLTELRRAAAGLSDAVKFLGCLSAKKGLPTSAAQLFVDKYPNALATPALRTGLERGELAMKAFSATSARTDVPEWAGVLGGGLQAPPAILGPLIDHIETALVVRRVPGFTRVPPLVPIPYEPVTAPTMQWISENTLKPVSQLAFADLRLPVCKAMAIVIFTHELMQVTANGAERVLSARLTHQATRFLDQQLLDPAVTAIAGQRPASLTATGTAVTPGADLDASLTLLVSTFFAMRPQALLPTFLLSPAVVAQVSESGHHPGLSVSGGTLLGLPAVVTSGAGQTVVLLDATAVYFNEALTLSTSEHALVTIDDTVPPPDGPVLRSLWQHNETGILLEFWGSWAAEPNSVAYVTVPAPVLLPAGTTTTVPVTTAPAKAKTR